MTKNFLTLIALAMSCLSVMSVSAQNKFDGFRGPNRDGLYPAETGLMKQWPAEGPQMLWEDLTIGKGYSSPVIVGDRLYITGMTEDEKQETFMAFTLDGKKLYTTVYGKPFNQSYPETRTTPTINSGKAYVISGMGEIACINCADGKMLWRVDGRTTYGSKTGNWGTAECPLVFGNKVIYSPGGSQTTIVALDKDTGKEIWKSRSLNDNRNYVQPTLISYKGKRQIVGGTCNYYYGVNPENGEIQWTFKDWYPQSSWENIAPNGPVFDEASGVLVFAQGYGINATALKLSDDMKNVSVAWKNNDLSTHHGGYVLLNGIIYGSNWINNNSGNWVAVNIKDGKTIFNTAWKGGKGKGSTISADGMLYFYDERRGFVGLAKPGNELNIVSEFRITKGEGPYWAHLVINNGVLYVRHGSVLQAYKIK